MKRRSKAEQLEIGRRIYENELSKYEVAQLYGIGLDTARSYMRYYRDINGLPAKNQKRTIGVHQDDEQSPLALSRLQSMTKRELIALLLREKIG